MNNKTIDSISNDLITQLNIAKVFVDNLPDCSANSIDFNEGLSHPYPRGQFLLTSSNDNAIRLYNCFSLGELVKVTHSYNYGCSLARFTHHDSSIIYASNCKNKNNKITNNNNEIIFYTSIYDNTILGKFYGHTNTIISLSMAPNSDNFISSSLDKSIRIYDLNIPNKCQGIIRTNSYTPYVCYDPEGMVLAAMINDNEENEIIGLYDIRNYSKGPFTFFKSNINLPLPSSIPNTFPYYTSMEFSPDGKYLLLNTRNNRMILLDSFTGNVIHTIQTIPSSPTLYSKLTNYSSIPTFTPDSNYIFNGSIDNNIYCYQLNNNITKTNDITTELTHFHTLKGHHDTVNIVKFNPYTLLCASTDNSGNLAFWNLDTNT